MFVKYCTQCNTVHIDAFTIFHVFRLFCMVLLFSFFMTDIIMSSLYKTNQCFFPRKLIGKETWNTYQIIGFILHLYPSFLCLMNLVIVVLF